MLMDKYERFNYPGDYIDNGGSPIRYPPAYAVPLPEYYLAQLH